MNCHFDIAEVPLSHVSLDLVETNTMTKADISATNTNTHIYNFPNHIPMAWDIVCLSNE